MSIAGSSAAWMIPTMSWEGKGDKQNRERRPFSAHRSKSSLLPLSSHQHPYKEIISWLNCLFIALRSKENVIFPSLSFNITSIHCFIMVSWRWFKSEELLKVSKCQTWNKRTVFLHIRLIIDNHNGGPGRLIDLPVRASTQRPLQRPS